MSVGPEGGTRPDSAGALVLDEKSPLAAIEQVRNAVAEGAPTAPLRRAPVERAEQQPAALDAPGTRA